MVLVVENELQGSGELGKAAGTELVEAAGGELVKAAGGELGEAAGGELGEADELLGDVVDGEGEVVHVPRGYSGHRDTPVLGHVDGELLGDLLHLLRGEARVTEHPDLVSDVAPVPGAPLPLQALPEGAPHRHDPARHPRQ